MVQTNEEILHEVNTEGFEMSGDKIKVIRDIHQNQ